MYTLLYSFLYTKYVSVVTSHKMFFSCIISTSSLSYVPRFFSKRELVKTLLRIQLKQTNLENRLHISTESPKGFNYPVSQHSVDELKHCNSDMRMDLPLLVPVFLCLYSLYLVVMLHFRMIFFHNVFCFISFSCECAIF